MCCWTAVCWNRTGYMELCSVCVLTESVLRQGRMGDWSEDVLLDSCLLEQDRIYGVMLFMCIDRECVETRENGGLE